MKNKDKNLQKQKVVVFLSQDSFVLSHFKARIQYLIDAGADVTVVARETSAATVKKIKMMRCSYVDSEMERSSTDIFKVIRELIRVASIIRGINPDFIHNFGLKPIIFGTASALTMKKRVGIINNLTGFGVVFSKNTFKMSVLRKVIIILLWLLLKAKNSRVISENVDDLKWLLKIKAVRYSCAYLIPGAGIDINRYYPVPWCEKEKKITAIMASRWLYSKGVLIFLEASKILARRNVPVQLWLVGESDNRNVDSIPAEVVNSYSENNDVLRIFGFRTDIPELLRACHICVLPSSYREGLPRFLIEGAATGLAIVTANRVGCRDAVSNENGKLLDKLTPEELAETIEYLSNNKEELKRQGKNSRRLAEVAFDENKVNKQILDVYLSLK